MKIRLTGRGLGLGLLVAALVLPGVPLWAATNDLTAAIQRGLFEEEANQNLGAAIQAYQSVANQFDKDRKLAATAIFRLGECYRKQGNTNEAAVQYDRILREFSDQPTLVTLSRQNLAALGSPAPGARTNATASAAATAEAERLSLESQLAELKALPKDKLRITIQQNYPNPVLTSLMQRLSEAEQNLAGLEKDYGPESMEVVKAKAGLEAINKQIDAQVEGTLRGLQIKLQVAAKTEESLQAQMGAAPVLSEAARQEQKRLLEEEIKLVQNQLDVQKKRIQVGRAGPESLWPIEREILELKRKVAAVEAGLPVPFAASETSVTTATTEADEVQRIQTLIKDSPDLINAPERNGETLLESAAAKGNLAVVKLLLDNGAAVDGLQQPGLTALHYAAANGHKAVVDLLLSKGAKAGAHTENDLTPLHLAASKGYEEVAKALLAAGAPVNAQTKFAQVKSYEDLQYNVGPLTTPLHLATLAGYTGMVELLLSKGADPNLGDGYGRTALSYAAERKRDGIVQALLAAHADPNGGGFDLPLASAAYAGDTNALKLLLAGGADPNTNSRVTWSVQGRGYGIGSGYRITPLVIAVTRHEADAVAELLHFKADPNFPDPSGNPPLLDALSDAPTLTALLDGGANPNAKTADGTPMLFPAVMDKNEAAVELLLAHRADVNCTNKAGTTPLYWAAGNGETAIAEVLLTAGAAVNAKDTGGNTPLYEAVRHYHPEMVELLLTHKADPNVLNKSWLTPLDLAERRAQSTRGPTPAITQQQEAKSKAMVELLRRYGALEDLPQPDAIEVRRGGNRINSPFVKGAHDWNHFTLLELFAVECDILVGSPDQKGGYRYTPSAFFSKYKLLPFPDLAHLRIRQPAPDMKSWHEQAVDFSPVLESGDCSKDVRLQWGDVVEIPEADHPLNAQWQGFSETELTNLKRCLTRQVEIVIKDHATSLTRAPGISTEKAPGGIGAPPIGASGQWFSGHQFSITAHTSFWLKPVLLQSRLVLTSSDLSRVKVIRRDPATGQEHEWVVDCSEASPAPGFWLENGDRIEVPEKTYESAQGETPQTAAPGAVAPQTAPAAQQPQPPQEGRPVIGPRRPATKEAAKPVADRWYERLVQKAPAVQSPKAAEDEQPAEAGGVRYSPKPDDAELLNEGYHRDRAARTRQAEVWEERAPSELRGRACPAAWTGTDMVVFGGEGMGTSFDDGARYCLAEDTWAMLPEEGAPSSRTGQGMIWTGKEVIVWGGFGGVLGNNTNHNDGAHYNPATDTWKPMSTKHAPAARFDFTAVWTGKEMLVWGGYTDSHSRYQGTHADAFLNSGGCYNPARDTWKPMTTRGAPSRRYSNTMVWTGKEMIVWGGGNADKVFNDGARYNPVTDSWRPMSTEGAPRPRWGHVAVWTGKEMIVWGGSAREISGPSDYFEDGARYNPETDTWRPISSVGAPKGRTSVSAVWTGTQMVFWGGVNDGQASDVNDPSRYVGTGACYNPATDTWTEITTTDAPSPRLTSRVWTGNGLLLFGGYNGRHLNDAWFYSPSRTLYPYSK